MVRIIMQGCSGHMGRVITGLVEKDERRPHSHRNQ